MMQLEHSLEGLYFQNHFCQSKWTEIYQLQIQIKFDFKFDFFDFRQYDY